MTDNKPASQSRGIHRLTLAIFCLALSACGASSEVANLGIPPLATAPTVPTLKIADFAVPEGASSETSQAQFRVNLAPASDQTVSVNFATADKDATAGDDYTAAVGNVTFAPGEIEKVVMVDIIGDDGEEPKERFFVTLSDASGAELGDFQALGTIANDDSPCELPASGSPNPWMEADRLLLNYSHRGGAEDFAENTLYSYKKSVEIGAHVLEMDVFENVDGDLIVIHDSTVDRTTNSSGDVSSFTTAELKAMDAAYWFVPSIGMVTDAPESDYAFRGIATGQRTPPADYDANDFTIPTLEEILQTFPDELINIELKPDPDSTGSYAIKVAELLLKYGRNDDVIVASFIDEPATELKLSAPCVSTSFPTGQAAAAVTQSQTTGVILNPAGHHAFQVPPSLGVTVVTPAFVEDAHDANIAVHVWTIDDCQEMVDLLNMDVDAIMTDRPSLLAQLLEQEPGSWTCDTVIWPLE
ncbi:MAG: glycerophosphoryl diester phosphodiesterase [Pseudoalteromonas tetraodonis]|jgi:glycerophosphoryl diester phosphodiesterase